MMVKLTDYGFATYCLPGEHLTKGVGSRYYIAPEILKKQNYGKKIDIWSATVVIYILLCGDMPYPGNNVAEVAAAIQKRNIAEDLKKNTGLSEEAKSFLLAGLTKKPEKRPSV